ncbi:MAG TPA: DUF3180 domain-containing protein [Microbacteriaceae bacterium]|nr:DUF3180 domain-containing protein [Microbacteriaceae bacterium]
MRRSSPSVLVGVALAGLVGGFLLEVALVSRGMPMLVPPRSLPIALLLIGAIALGLAIPIHRAVRGTRKSRIDPFQAVRVAVLAKASSLLGAAATGIAVGMLVYAFTRPLLPQGSLVLLDVAFIVAAALLLAAGLVAEYLCTLPPPEDGEAADAARPDRG